MLKPYTKWIYVTVITIVIEMGKGPVLLRKEDKTKVKLDLNFVSQKQIDMEMDELLEHYGASKSQANLDKTRKVLKRFGNFTDELAAMRDENR